MQTKTFRAVIAALGATLVTATPGYAQLDPLLFLKTTQPNVIIAVDTSQRMQRDADNTYYDPGTYTKSNASIEAALGLVAGEAAASYRRKYFNLQHENATATADEKFSASSIAAVGDLETGYSTFYERTRLAIARRGVAQAITDNAASARFALVRMRQATPALPGAGKGG